MGLGHGGNVVEALEAQGFQLWAFEPAPIANEDALPTPKTLGHFAELRPHRLRVVGLPPKELYRAGLGLMPRLCQSILQRGLVLPEPIEIGIQIVVRKGPQTEDSADGMGTGQALRRNDLVFQVLQAGIVEPKLPLESVIGHASPLA